MQAQKGSDGVYVVPAYSAEPVPKDLIREIFDAARRTPSWHNPHGWHISVLTGAALQRFKDDLTEKLHDNVPGSPDLDVANRAWPELCLLRTARLMADHEEAEAMAGLEGTREEKLARLGQLFGAPCALIFTVDCETTGSVGCFDSGAFIHCMCQAAGDRGLSTCVLATAVKYPAVLHAVLPDQAGRLFVVGVALGYPDTDSAVGTFFGEPVEFDRLVSWVE